MSVPGKIVVRRILFHETMTVDSMTNNDGHVQSVVWYGVEVIILSHIDWKKKNLYEIQIFFPESALRLVVFCFL